MHEPPQLLDPRRADVRVTFGVARAEVAQQAVNRFTAEQWAAIADVLDEARTSPDVFVDPAFSMRPDERAEFAVRAAAADLAVRLGISEATVRGQGFDAVTLRDRLPRVWAAFREGDVVVANARIAADLVRSLPDEATIWAQFDGALSGILGLTPTRFRARARVLRERIHSIPLAERFVTAASARGVWIENLVDGMAQLGMILPAADAHRAYARIDAGARALATVPGESRTLAHLRADVARDVMLGGEATSPATRVTVAVTVPVMTLLGHADEPGTLDGYGPIDADTARRLAAGAPSFTRLLTHPVSGALLDIDRRTYRVPADLKKWLQIRDVMCCFPGCGRLARTSDIDHTVDHQYGGATSAANLAHLCRHHHRLKHVTRWSVRRASTAPGPGLVWTSPTGQIRTSDPPPF